MVDTEFMRFGKTCLHAERYTYVWLNDVSIPTGVEFEI
jgi:hypothetical protein